MRKHKSKTLKIKKRRKNTHKFFFFNFHYFYKIFVHLGKLPQEVIFLCTTKNHFKNNFYSFSNFFHFYIDVYLHNSLIFDTK